jgi:hypothetical protein
LRQATVRRHSALATLAEIMEATGWPAHSVRGFISTAGKKPGVRIESSKNDSGDRVYRIANRNRPIRQRQAAARFQGLAAAFLVGLSCVPWDGCRRGELPP